MVKCLPWKQEDLTLIHRIHVKSQVWWCTLAVPTLGRQRQADAWGSPASLTSLLNELPAKKWPSFWKQVGLGPEEHHRGWPLTSTCTDMHMELHTHIHEHTCKGEEYLFSHSKMWQSLGWWQEGLGLAWLVFFFWSIWHKLESSGKTETQLRKCFYQTGR